MIAPYFSDGQVSLYLSDCRDVLPTLPDASIDALACDPPYEIGFMGRGWDASGIAYDTDMWRECWRVLKPGSHLLAFGATRTYHRLAVAIEDAGFEIRDSIHWIYGNGFPKSHDVSKALDQRAGASRDAIGTAADFARDGAQRTAVTEAIPHGQQGGHGYGDRWSAPITIAASDGAIEWAGWGTALKPAHEPIIVARKPLRQSVAVNVLEHGTGAINIDACRVPHINGENPSAERRTFKAPARKAGSWANDRRSAASFHAVHGGEDLGRWPTNLVFSHSPACGDNCAAGCPVADLDTQTGVLTSGAMAAGTPHNNRSGYSGALPATTGAGTHGDSGGASRFFPAFRYEPKAPASERPRLAPKKAMRLREDLTDEQRAYVLAELMKAGVDVA